MPSWKIDVCEEKPRIVNVSPEEVLPFSPSWIVMPGVLRSASTRLSAPWSAITCPLMMLSVWGVLTSSWVSLAEADLSIL